MKSKELSKANYDDLMSDEVDVWTWKTCDCCQKTMPISLLETTCEKCNKF